jgi:DNA mismatch repair protein MutL
MSRFEAESMRIGEYEMVGQLRNSYIVLQDNEHVYYVDQHALAERILYEKMKQDAIDHEFVPEPLLQPISIRLAQMMPLEDKLRQLSER